MNAAKKKSKKRSEFHYGKKPLEILTIFIDRALGKHKISNTLLNFNNPDQNPKVKVLCSDDIFPHSIPDEKWLEEAGKSGWIVITKDKRIRYRRAEFEIVKKHKVRMFTLTRGNLTGDKMAEIILNAMPNIIKYANRYEPPFIVTISKSGNLNKLDID